jgi:hypothetical protein
VDNIIYFSNSDAVERMFECLLSTIGEAEFMGQVTQFLGIKFNWRHHQDGYLRVSLTQQSFAETLIKSLGFVSESVSSFTTPYHSGFTIDSITTQSMSSADQDILCLNYQSLAGSLNWLEHTTPADLSTVVSLLLSIKVILIMVIYRLHATLSDILQILKLWIFILPI